MHTYTISGQKDWKTSDVYIKYKPNQWTKMDSPTYFQWCGNQKVGPTRHKSCKFLLFSISSGAELQRSNSTERSNCDRTWCPCGKKICIRIILPWTVLKHWSLTHLKSNPKWSVGAQLQNYENMLLHLLYSKSDAL